jgi:hypothetical protein
LLRQYAALELTSSLLDFRPAARVYGAALGLIPLSF